MRTLLIAALFSLGLSSAARAETPDAGSPVDAARSQYPTCTARPCILAARFEGIIDDDVAAGFVGWAAHINTVRPEAVAIIIESPGGNFTAAQVIVQTMRQIKTPVHCIVNRNAQSAAFWILQACPDRVALPESHLMMHEPIVRTIESETKTIKDLRNDIADLLTLSAIMEQTILPRIGMTHAQYLDKITDRQWHLTGAEAFTIHVVDALATDIPSYFHALSARYHVPEGK